MDNLRVGVYARVSSSGANYFRTFMEAQLKSEGIAQQTHDRDLLGLFGKALQRRPVVRNIESPT